MSRHHKELPQKFQVELTSQPKNWTYIPVENRELLEKELLAGRIEAFYPSGATDNLIAIKARLRKAYLVYFCGIPMGFTKNGKKLENVPKVSSQKVLAAMIPQSSNKVMKMDYERCMFLTQLT